MKAITADDRRRLKSEIRKQVDEYLDRRCLDTDTYVMWVLHKRFGFGALRLRRYFDAYVEEYRRQHQTYTDLTAEKMREALKHNLGVDLEAWEREV